MTIKNSLTIIIAILALGLVSCDKFLDTMPDKRTELDTEVKIKEVLVSAYPGSLPNAIYEYSSDNTTDNGTLYTFSFLTFEQAYKWIDITDNGWDTNTWTWRDSYKAIASANHALEALDKMGNPKRLMGLRAEALLCRAYSHLILANTFCIAYNPLTSDTDLGIPYMKKTEKVVQGKYERGTVSEVYANINQDIEDALPYITDNYSVPKYHFNAMAAYAFAARFNLFYGKWDKAAEYATKSIGEDPTAIMRNMSKYLPLPSAKERSRAYSNDKETCNLMILATNSIWGRTYNGGLGDRYAHNREIASKQTVWTSGPWGNLLNIYNNSTFGTDQVILLAKCHEMFEYTNEAANIGIPHVVWTEFTTEETLLCRAEAHVMMKEYDKAARDLSYWYSAKQPNTIKTADEISNWYKTANPNIKIPFATRFTIESEMQTNMLHACLHARRIEKIHEGSRWLDIRRHGIKVKHIGVEKDLEPYEARTAFQLPADVINSGMQPNDR